MATRRTSTKKPAKKTPRKRPGKPASKPSPAGPPERLILTPEQTRERYQELQTSLVDRWLALRDLDLRARDVVVVPSLSLDGFQLEDIVGVNHYEERMLFTLGLLRHPRARIVFVTSQPLQPVVVDYYLALVGGIPTAHARERLTLLCTYDSTAVPLTRKILDRPRLIERIRSTIHPERAHLSVFTVSEAERELAVALGLPLYGVDPELLWLGTKSGSREVFREAGVDMATGVENLHSEKEVAEGVAEVWEKEPKLRRVMVKLNEGFSGEGNAVLKLGPKLQRVAPGKATRRVRVEAVTEALDRDLQFVGTKETWPRFRSAFERIGGVVEAFVEGKKKCSPSAQLRINPRGELEAMSTHDQMLGNDGQTYLGCTFPAVEDYRIDIQNDALRVGEVLRDRGVVGRVAVDFVAVEAKPGVWERYAIEINMRMTGTTHPMMTLNLLNDGTYDPDSGLYLTRRGEPRFYLSSDNMSSPAYRGLLPEDLLDIAAVHELHYRPWQETGVVFHLLGALSQYGKCGVTAIGASPEETLVRFERVRSALDKETAAGPIRDF